jgi:homoserine kinase type II
MATDADVQTILSQYPPDCAPRQIKPLGNAGGFSGSKLWSIDAPRGRLCLRQWPAAQPSQQRLDFIHAVLRHVAANGFRRLPLPIPAATGATYVEHAGRLWELAPWMPGEIDRAAATSPTRITAALEALAEFHLASSTFSHSGVRFGPSPGLIERKERLERLLAGELNEIERSLDDRLWPELAQRGRRYLSVFRRAAPDVNTRLHDAASIAVPWQPCLRDIWRENVLFVGEDVSAILDFASMRVETVAGDVARLIGSFAGDDHRLWEQALAAYRKSRPLADGDVRLVTAFDQSGVLLTGVSWLDWVFRQRREFPDKSAVMERFNFALGRLESLGSSRAGGFSPPGCAQRLDTLNGDTP